MTDEIMKKIYNKYIKDWLNKKHKYIATILLYILYHFNFLIYFFSYFGLKITKFPKTYKISFLFLNDLIYVLILLWIFKDDIKKGLKDLKDNFTNRAIFSLNCWIIGCSLMFLSSLIINFILNKEVSTNEALIRQSIKIAPIYMLFTCSVVAPLFEELVFRKSLQGLVKKKWLFICLSGLIFGLLHVLGSYNNITDFLYVIPYGAMGCSFAYLLSKTDNITLPIIIHMIHNTILVLLQIIGG